MKASESFRKEVKNNLDLEQIVFFITDRLRDAIDGANNYEDKENKKKIYYVLNDDKTIFNLMLKLGLVRKDIAFHQDVTKKITAHHITPKAIKLYEQLKKEGVYKK